MKFISAVALFLLITVSGLACAESSIENKSPFDDYVRINENLYVANPTIYIRSKARESSKTSINEERGFLGKVEVTKGRWVDIVRTQASNHEPSALELLDSSSGEKLGVIDMGVGSSGQLLFNGAGDIYWSQTIPPLCYGLSTRKLQLIKNKLIEVSQPFFPVGAPAIVGGEMMNLFETSKGGKKVATVGAWASVSVLGVSHVPGPNGLNEIAKNASFLIKTPLGLVGWHVPKTSGRGANLSITQCG